MKEHNNNNNAALPRLNRTQLYSVLKNIKAAIEFNQKKEDQLYLIYDVACNCEDALLIKEVVEEEMIGVGVSFLTKTSLTQFKIYLGE